MRAMVLNKAAHLCRKSHRTHRCRVSRRWAGGACHTQRERASASGQAEVRDQPVGRQLSGMSNQKPAAIGSDLFLDALVLRLSAAAREARLRGPGEMARSVRPQPASGIRDRCDDTQGRDRVPLRAATSIDRLQVGLDLRAPGFEEGREREALAEGFQRFVDGKARAVGRDLEEIAARLPEVE